MRAVLSVCVFVLLCSAACAGKEHKKDGDHGDREHGSGHSHNHGHHDNGHGHHHGHNKDGHGHGHHHGHHKHHGHGHHHGNDSLRLYKENGEFAFNLYKHLTSQPDSQDKNVFFSPLSVSLALAALAVGTRGLTQKQLYDGIGFNNTHLSTEEVNDGFHQIIMDLNQESEVDLSLGTALFINDTFQPLPEFLQILKRYFHSEVFSTDFTDSKKAVQAINDYVKNKTQDKIAELVDKLGTDTVLFLLSYMYFKGTWETEFNPENNEKDVFHVNDTKTVPVEMMTRSGDFEVYYDPNVSAHLLKLPYNGLFSMVLILPEKGIKGFEKIFTRNLMSKWWRSFRKMPYRIHVPKFSVEGSFSLDKILMEMGIKEMFGATADLTGIAKAPLFVTKVVHKATLDVDERGSEAAGTSGVELSIKSSQNPVPSLKFDKPFIVLLSAQRTRSYLFMGRVVNPGEK